MKFSNILILDKKAIIISFLLCYFNIIIVNLYANHAHAHSHTPNQD